MGWNHNWGTPSRMEKSRRGNHSAIIIDRRTRQSIPANEQDRPQVKDPYLDVSEWWSSASDYSSKPVAGSRRSAPVRYFCDEIPGPTAASPTLQTARRTS